MKRKIWVAAMTATMLVGLTTTASAQERQRNRRGNAEQAAPATPAVSREFATAFGPLQTALGARDWATADTALATARAAATNPYEQYLVARADLMIGSGQQNQKRRNQYTCIKMPAPDNQITLVFSACITHNRLS